MCAYDDENVHALALRGACFDDCQKIVKGLFADQQFHARHSLGAVNSINWARIVAQIVYYFYASFQVDAAPVFSVPTGNFGDVLAGWYAKEMGCACRGLVVATNANDILARFFASGTYSRPPSAVETLAPSMDICVSSNFERFVFHCSGNDAAQTKSLMDQFEKTGAFTAPPALKAKAQSEMKAASVQKEEILATIKSRKEATGYVLDPHTACGVRAAEDLKSQLGSGPVICLACAHHGKFPAAIEAALGADAKSVPPEKALTDLLSVPHRKDILENSARGGHRLRREDDGLAQAGGEEGADGVRLRVGRRAAGARIPWAFLGSKVGFPIRPSRSRWSQFPPEGLRRPLPPRHRVRRLPRYRPY